MYLFCRGHGDTFVMHTCGFFQSQPVFFILKPCLHLLNHSNALLEMEHGGPAALSDLKTGTDRFQPGNNLSKFIRVIFRWFLKGRFSTADIQIVFHGDTTPKFPQLTFWIFMLTFKDQFFLQHPAVSWAANRHLAYAGVLTAKHTTHSLASPPHPITTLPSPHPAPPPPSRPQWFPLHVSVGFGGYHNTAKLWQPVLWSWKSSHGGSQPPWLLPISKETFSHSKQWVFFSFLHE